jgi:hypothetical protein
LVEHEHVGWWIRGGNSVTLAPENREDETHIVTSADLGLPVEDVAAGTESTATVGWVYRDSEGVIELSIQHLTNDSRPPDGLGTCNHRPSSGGTPAVPALLVILALGGTVRAWC